MLNLLILKDNKNFPVQIVMAQQLRSICLVMGIRKLQNTIKHKVMVSGVGLHSGKTIHCTLHPATENHGIVFVRSDLASKPKIPAHASNVVRTQMCTTLGVEGAMISTVEHLMAALAGLEIDNVLIEVDGPELPILDGSSQMFVDAILKAGLKSNHAPKKYLRLKKKITVRNGDKWMVAEPSNSFSITGGIEFNHTLIGKQTFAFSENQNFQSEVASARTFGFIREVEVLHKNGFALGASLDNAVVLDEATVLNPDGLRFTDEFVRHKVLDAIGDLALLGMQIKADISIHKSGHDLHVELARKILENPANYEIVEYVGTPVHINTEEETADLPLVAVGAY